MADTQHRFEECELAKLPKWAQSRINLITRQRDSLAAKLEAEFPEVDPYGAFNGPTSYDGMTARKLNCHQVRYPAANATVRYDADRKALLIHVDRDMTVIPLVSNEILVKGRSWNREKSDD